MNRLSSVRARVVAIVLVVAAAATVLTAWLSTRAAETAIRSNARQSLEDDAAIYQSLVEYGLANPDWSQVGPVLASLNAQYDRRIAITDLSGRLLQDSDRAEGGSSRPLPPNATARVDPLSPSVSQFSVVAKTEASTLVLDPAAVDASLACLDDESIPYEMVDSGNGPLPQPGLDLTTSQFDSFVTCTEQLYPTSSTSTLDVAEANRAYDDAYRSCIVAEGFTVAETDFGDTVAEQTPEAFEADSRCITKAITASTAPVVLLYLGTPTQVDPFGGTSPGTTAAIIFAIVALAAGAAWWLGRRLTKPLVQLTDGARRLEAGEFSHRVPTPSSDELGVLGHAFNSMAASLQRNEGLRRQMVSDIAHELRNPLVTINGTLEAIEDGVYEPSPEVIGSLADEASHLTRLVNDLQQLATADAGGLRLELRQGDLHELVRSVADGYDPRATASGVELVVESVGESGAVFDSDRMRQVVGNLIANAIRHTDTGGTITVSVGDGAITVADTGEGIAPDDLGHVFERFWRADSSRARATGGSGLGLAIAKELIAAHGATIAVASRLGEGTTFSIEGISRSTEHHRTAHS